MDKNKSLVKREDRWDLYDENGHKIASTLQGCSNMISLKNCQAIERGYDLDELADEYVNPLVVSTDKRMGHWWGFMMGFQKALDLMGDKRFNSNDMSFMFACGRNYQRTGDTDCTFLYVIKSLQQTEWDVEIEMEFVGRGKHGIGSEVNHYMPKRDTDGCLILKLKSE